MQRFIETLRRDPARLLGIRDLIEAVNTLSANRWTDLIAEGIAALARELADKTMPVPDLIEWFAEWARDTRSEQRGLLLLTAHRSKGLQFDHAAILNGGWDAPSRGEDADAPRRLFYVAMTRARRGLCIMANGAHPFLQQDGEHVLWRNAPPQSGDVVLATEQYQMPNLKAVDLSWAGRLSADHPSLRAIAEAQVGDPVRLVNEAGAWLIHDARGRALGRMARSWSPPEGLGFLRGEVGAVVRWRKTDNKEEFRAHLRREVWEAVCPELVYG
jgi:ATP-dependent DNA helicase RecQ